VVPRAFPHLCTKKLLVLERLEGPTLTEMGHEADTLAPELRARLGEQLVRAVLGPWLHHGAIHADVHPGNYLALPDGRLGVLDFGCVKVASSSLHTASRSLLAALAEGRRADWVALHRQAGFTWSVSDAKLSAVLEDILALAGRPLSGPYDFGADTTVKRLSDLKLRYPLDLIRIQPPPEGIMVGRALAGLLQNLVALKATLDVGALLRQELGGSSPNAQRPSP
jgi:predicted unusual protein kinase regulating ubiquinone biosynthesis (AarF/ABC1/UbiB family)